MNALHHRAFDADLFTVTSGQRLRVNPEFEPGHPFLQEMIVLQDGEQVTLLSEATVGDEYLAERNNSLAWV